MNFKLDKKRHKPRFFLRPHEKVYDDLLRKNRGRVVSSFSGVLATGSSSFVKKELKRLRPDIRFNVYPVQNKFFGPDITVTGLLTGQDILSTLMDKQLGDTLLVPASCLKAGEEIFLDDMSLAELGSALQVKTIIVKSYGIDYLRNIVGV